MCLILFPLSTIHLNGSHDFSLGWWIYSCLYIFICLHQALHWNITFSWHLGCSFLGKPAFSAIPCGDTLSEWCLSPPVSMPSSGGWALDLATDRLGGWKIDVSHVSLTSCLPNYQNVTPTIYLLFLSIRRSVYYI